MEKFLTLEDCERIVKKVLTESIEEANEDFGTNVKGDLTIDDIKQGEPVYHRPQDSRDSNPLSVIQSLMQNGFSREYTGDNGGNMYGPGVYNVYSLRSSNDRATGYGRYIVQSYVLGGYKDFLIFNIDIAKKYYGENWPIVNQIKMLMPRNLAEKVLHGVPGLNHCMNNNKTSYDIKTSIPAVNITRLLGNDINKTKIRGIIYSGGHDGNCCFVRNFSDVIPYSYSADNGKTWTVGITENLIWRAGHNTDVDAMIRNRVDDNGKKLFSDVADRSINGYVRVYKNNKVNYFEVATNKLISDVWFDFAEDFDDDDTAKVVYNGEKYYIMKHDNGAFIVLDEDECPVCYLNDLPKNV